MEGKAVDLTQCRRMFDLPGFLGEACEASDSVVNGLVDALAAQRAALLEDVNSRNANWFTIEMDKLDRWAEDRRSALKSELEEFDQAFRDAKKAARLAPTLPEKLERQRAARSIESKREEAWRSYDEASRQIERQKDALLDEITQRLEQELKEEPLFLLRWRIT